MLASCAEMEENTDYIKWYPPPPKKNFLSSARVLEIPYWSENLIDSRLQIFYLEQQPSSYQAQLQSIGESLRITDAIQYLQEHRVELAISI